MRRVGFWSLLLTFVGTFGGHSEVQAWTPEVHEALLTHAINQLPREQAAYYEEDRFNLHRVQSRMSELYTISNLVSEDDVVLHLVMDAHTAFWAAKDAGNWKAELYYLALFSTGLADLFHPGHTGFAGIVKEGKTACHVNEDDLFADIEAAVENVELRSFTPWYIDFDDITQWPVFIAWETHESLKDLARTRCEYEAHPSDRTWKIYETQLKNDVDYYVNRASEVIGNWMVTR